MSQGLQAKEAVKSRYPKMIRAISLALVIAFTLNDFAQAAPAEMFQARLIPNPSSLQFSGPFAKISDIYQGKAPRLLIHIQDAHTNSGAEKNLAMALEELVRKYKIKTVFIEGGTQDDSLDFLRSEASPASRRIVAKKYLMNGEMNGAEYLSLSSDENFKILGVEQADLYRENLKTYARVAENRDAVLSYIEEIGKRVDSLKRRIYAPDVLALDDFLVKYRRKEKDFTEYYQLLSQTSERLGINLLGYPHFMALKDLKAREEKIDFKKANREQEALASQLSQKDLAARAEKLKSGILNPLPFFEAMLDEARDKKIDLSAYTNFTAYVDYLREYSSVKMDKLLKETHILEEIIYQKALAGDDAFYLYRLDRYLAVLKSLFSLQASPEEFDEYTLAQKDIRFSTPVCLAFINRKLYDLGNYGDTVATLPILDDNKKLIEDFYRTTADRDEVFLDKSLAEMDKDNITSAVLITGGYHTPSLKQRMKERGISYAVVTPAVTEETNLKRYEKILLSRAGLNPSASSGRTAADAKNSFVNTPEINDPLNARLQLDIAGLRRDLKMPVVGGDGNEIVPAGNQTAGEALLGTPSLRPSLDKLLGIQNAGQGARMAQIQPERIVIADNIDANKLDIKGLKDLSKTDAADLNRAIIEADPVVLMVRSATQVNQQLVEQLPNLKYIIRLGHGTDNVKIDDAYAQSRGIEVIATKGSAKSVAELSLRMMLSAVSHKSGTTPVKSLPQFLPTTSWEAALAEKTKKTVAPELDEIRNNFSQVVRPVRSEDAAASLRGMTVGVIGATGDIGSEFAKMALALGMEVWVYSPTLARDTQKRNELEAQGYRFATKEEMYAHANFVVPFTGLISGQEEGNTEGMFDKDAVDAMLKNQDFIALVNTDRGGLVVEKEIERLVAGGKKYISDEKPKSAVLQKDTVYLPHIGGSTPEGKAEVLKNANVLLNDKAAARMAEPVRMDEPVLIDSLDMLQLMSQELVDHHIAQINDSSSGVMAPVASDEYTQRELYNDLGTNFPYTIRVVEGTRNYLVVDRDAGARMAINKKIVRAGLAAAFLAVVAAWWMHRGNENKIIPGKPAAVAVSEAGKPYSYFTEKKSTDEEALLKKLVAEAWTYIDKGRELSHTDRAEGSRYFKMAAQLLKDIEAKRPEWIETAKKQNLAAADSDNPYPLRSAHGLKAGEARFIAVYKKYGTLYDVAAIHFIAAQAVHELYINSTHGGPAFEETARRSGVDAMKAVFRDFPYAQVFDPKGWMWRPVDGLPGRSPIRLEALKELETEGHPFDFDAFQRDLNRSRSDISEGARMAINPKIQPFIPLLVRKDFPDDEAILAQNIQAYMIAGNDNLDTFKKIIYLYAGGMDRADKNEIKIILSGGKGRLTPPLRKAAEELPGASATLAPDIPEAEIIKEIMIRMAADQALTPGLLHREEVVRRFKDSAHSPFILEGESRYTLENFEKVSGILHAQNLLVSGAPLRFLYIQTPWQQLRTAGMFNKVFKDEISAGQIQGVSYTIDVTGEDIQRTGEEAVKKTIVGELFRIVANIKKGDVVFENGVNSIPEAYWKDARELFESLSADDRQEVANLMLSTIGSATFRMTPETLKNGLSGEVLNFVETVLGSASGARMAISRRRFMQAAGAAAVVAATAGLPDLSLAQQNQVLSNPQVKAELTAYVRFLLGNVTKSGFPRSYRLPKDYYKGVKYEPGEEDTLESILERVLTENSLNIYDGAVNGMVLDQAGETEAADRYSETIRSNRTLGLDNIRGWKEFVYYEGQNFFKENAMYFRMVSGDSYTFVDPLDGKTKHPSFPNDNPAIRHEDWKPIAGENAWEIMRAVQKAFNKDGIKTPYSSPEIQQALSLLDVFEAMQSATGGIYHAPLGTAGKIPYDISTENNASAYAAFKMLLEVLVKAEGSVSDRQKKAALTAQIKKIRKILNGDATTKHKGIEGYFKEYAYDKTNGIFFQGGVWNKETSQFDPSADFATDVQTWTVAALGPEWVVKNIGSGDPAVLMTIWENTLKKSGYYKGKTLKGVGFTAQHDIISSEWTFGAILMVREMAKYYEGLAAKEAKNKAAYTANARRLWEDSRSMRKGIDEELKVVDEDGAVSYKYANKRYFIPFGWWANPIPSTAGTGWAFFIDGPTERNYFNPFILGGGKDYVKVKLEKAAPSKTTAAGKEAEAKPDQKVETDDLYGANGGETWRTWYTTKGTVKNLQDFKEIEVAIPVKAGQTAFSVGLLLTDDSGGEYLQKITIPAAAAKKGGMYTVRIPVKTLKGMKGISEAHFGEGTGLQGKYNPANKLILNKDNDEKFDNQNLGNPEIRLFKKSSGARMAAQRIPAIFLPYMDFEKAQKRLFEVAFPGRAYDPGMPYDVPVTSVNGNTFSAPQRISYIYDLAFLNSEIRRLSPAEDLYAKTVFLFVVIPYRVAANIFLTLFDFIMSFIPGRSGARMASIPDLEKENVWNIVDLGQYILQAKSIIYREDRSLPEDVTARVYVVTGERQDVTVSVQTEASGLIRAVSIQKRWLPSSITLPEQTFKDYPDSSLKSIERDLRTKLRKQTDAIAVNMPGTSLRFVNVVVPDNFAPHLNRHPYDLVTQEISVASLDNTAEASLEVLKDPLAQLVVSGSVGQAISSVMLAGKGKSIKELADAQAMHFTERIIQDQVERHRDTAVVVLADEGSKDGSFSLAPGSIYIYDEAEQVVKEYKYSTFSHLREQMIELRTRGITILKFAGDGLDNTNGFVPAESAFKPGNSMALFSLFVEDRQNAETWLDGEHLHLIDDNFRLGGVSYSSPADAGVEPFDLPGAALEKIIAARAVARGIDPEGADYREFHDEFMNHTTVLTLGPRDASVAKANEKGGLKPHRHQRIMDDAENLKKLYPGLNIVKPGDGDLLPRAMAMIGADLDGRHLVVFGRSGAPEAVSTTIISANRPQAQHSYTLASEKPTTNDFSAEKAHAFTDDDRELFQHYNVSESAATAVRKKRPVTDRGVFAITSVTGASEDIYGADFSRNFDRVQFIPDAQGEGGSVVTSTLLVHPTGSFLVKTRFRTSNLLHTKAGILGASGPVRHRIDQLTGYMRTRLQGENLINLEDAVSDYHSGNIENAADYLNRINVADDDAETLSGLNELKLFTTAAAARLAAQAQQTTAKIPAIDDIRLFGQQRVEGINVALPSEIRVAVDGRLIKLVFSEIPNTPPPGGAGAGPRSIVRYASTEPAFAIRLSVDKEGSLRSLVRLGENDPLDMETSNTLRTPVGAVLKGLFEGAVEDNQNLNQLAGARAAVPGFVELEKMIETAVAVRRTETSADTIQYELTGLFEKRNVTIGFAGQAPTGRIADKITVASGLSQEPAQTIQRDSINAANFDSLAAQLEKNAVLKGPIADVAGLNQFFGAALAVRTLSVANNLIQYEAVISIGSNGSYTSRRINLSFVQRQEAWIPAQFAVLAAPGTKEVSQVIARNPSNQKDFDALTVRFMAGGRDFGSDAGAQAGITRDDLLSYLQAATPDFQFTVPAGRAPSYRFILPNNVRNRIIRWRYIVYPPVVIPTFNLDTLVLNLVPIQADEHTVNVIVVKTDRTQPIFSAIKELTAAAAARLPGVAQQDTNPLGPNREILTVRVRSIGNNDFTVTVSLAKNPPLIRKDIHIENFEPETLAQAIAIQFNRQFSATAVEEINARLETEIENAIGSLVVPVEPVEPVAKSPVVSVPVPGTGKKTFHQPTIDEINRAQGNVDVEALQREMDQLSKTDTLSIQNQRRFFEGLATEAAKEPNPVTVTLNVLQANGQIGTDTIVLPASKIELLAAGREGLISRLEYHLATLFNIRGVINGGTEIHITSSNETVLPAGSLLVNVKRILETEFGNTLTFASFGSKEGVLFKNEPLVAENRHGVTGLSAEPVDFNQPGIGFDLGGTNIKIARRDNTGEESKLTLTSKSLAELASEGALAQFIEAQILATPAAVPASGEVRYVVITIPGPVTPLGKIVNITNLEVSRRGTQAELEKLQQDLEQKGIHLIFQNDANAAAFYYQTAHSIAGNVIVNTLGTGVGHAVIKNGRLGEGPMEAHIRYTLNPNAEFHQGFGIKGDLESIANAAFVVSEATHFLIEAELDVPDNLTAETVGQWLVTPPSDNPEKHRQIAETVFRQVGRNLFILHQETARVNDEKEWTVVLFGGIAQGASAQEIIKGIQEASSGSDITLRNIIAIPEAASAGAIGALNLGLQANQYAVSAARLATAESPLLVESAAQELRVNTGFGQSSNISDTTLNPVVAGARLVEAHHSSLQLNRQEVFDILKTAQLPNDELPSFLEFSLTALPDGVEVVSADVPAALPFAPARFSKPLVFYPGVTRLLQRRGSVSLAQVETVAALANAEAILAGQFPALLGKKSGAWNNLMKEQPTNAGALKDVEIFLTADIMKNVADLRQALQKADLVSRSRGVNVILNILTRTEGLTEAEADLVASELKTLNNPRLGITTDGRLAQGQTLYDFALGKLSQQRNGLTNLQQGATNLVLIANSGNKDEILRQVGNTGGIYQNSIFAAGADLPPADQSGLASYSLAEMIATSLYQAMGLQSMISENLGLKVIVDPNTGFRYYIFKFNIGKELANLRLSKLAEIAA